MKYDDAFFDYVDAGAIRSARILVRRLFDLLRPTSVLDVGCGRGGWLAAWRDAGCVSVQGVDGDYVDQARLLIGADVFRPIDLAAPFDLGRRFDLVQCLEVAEHVNPACSAVLIDSIVKHGDIVLFSAAPPGQGGTGHVNERPLDYWRKLFADRGYAAFDAIRPLVHRDRRIEAWYRFNTIIYANVAGQMAMPPTAKAARVAEDVDLRDFDPLSWRMRKALLRHLPTVTIDTLAAINARVHRAGRLFR